MTSQKKEQLAAVDAGFHGGTALDSDALLHRGLGTGSIVFMVVSAAAPMTTAAAVTSTFAVTQNYGMALYYLIAGVVLTIFSVGFTLMTKYVPNAGAFYSYVQAGLGRIAGLGTATLALGSYYLLLLGLNVYIGVAVGNVIRTYTGASLPWLPLALAVTAIVALLGYRDVELSARVLGVLLTFETLSVIVLDVAIAVKGGAHGITMAPLLPPVFNSGGLPFIALMFAFLGFIGFEATAVFRTEARDPERTIPRATFISIWVIGIFYALTSWMLVVGDGVNKILPDSDSEPTTLVFNMAKHYVAPAMYNILETLIVTSLFACLLSFHNVIARYQLTLGREGVLPKRVAAIHPRHHAPSNSSLVVSVLIVVGMVIVWLTGMDPVLQANAWFMAIATLGILALMALTSAAAVAFFWGDRRGHSIVLTRVAPLVAFVLLTAVVVEVIRNFSLLVGSNRTSDVLMAFLAAFFLSGLIVGGVLRVRRPALYAALGQG